MTPPRRRWSRRRRALVAFAGVLVLLFAARGWVLPGVAGFLDVSEPPQRVDYVLVLGGGLDSRPFAAAELHKARLAGKILVGQVAPSADQKDGITPPEDVMTRRVLLARGVPADAIVTLPGECVSTLDEARGLASFLDSHPGASVAVVTNAFHTRRARWIFRRVLGDRPNRLLLFAAPMDGFDATDWWRHAEGLTTYLEEYVKLAAYLVLY